MLRLTHVNTVNHRKLSNRLKELSTVIQ